jgi:hypothetical protein
MKKSLPVLAAALPVLAMCVAPTADAASRLARPTEAFKFAPKSSYELANGGKALSLSNLKQSKLKSRKVVSEADLKTKLPAGYAVGYLNAPDGSTWFYTQDLTYTEVELEGGWATKKVISKYSFTIYDSDYNEVGKVSDDIVLGDNETGVSDIQLGACVTQKFFNSDTNYEVMVMIAANTPQYVNHVYTKVYSIGKEGALDTIEGYYIDAINSGTYSEKYYITFFQDEYLPKSEVYGTDATADDESSDDTEEETVYAYHYEIYGPASYSNPKASVLKKLITPYDQLEGYDATPFIGAVNDGSAYFAVMNYAKPYFANSAITYDKDGNMTRDLTPNKDNSLVVNLYKASYSGVTLDKTTTIPMELKDETGTTCSFYEVGLMDYSNDVSFGTWTDDDNPSYVVAIEDYVSNTDESVYSFKAFDCNGNKIADIFDDADALVDVSDIAGFEHQQGFYKTIDGVESFQYINIPSCKVAATLPVVLESGNSLTSSSDRIATADSYQYAFSLAYGISDDDDNTSHYIAWFNADGSFDHNEIIPLGKQVAQALPYVKTTVLSPYLFNTDSKREYMFLLKNYVSSSSTETAESFIIINTDGDVIAKLSETEDLGYLSSINLINADSDPALWIIYYNDENEKYTSTFLPLPLTKFEKGGDGSAENPYLIASVGDLQQMKGNLTASYKLANDIDAAGFDFQPVGEIFKGSLDGGNHTISNLKLANSNYYSGLFQQVSGTAVVKDIKFKDVKVVIGSDNSTVALIAPELSGDGAGAPEISGIHVDGYTVSTNDASSVNFGGLVGRMSLNATVHDCSIYGADFGMAEGVSSIGGIANQMITGANIDRCAFNGAITGGTYVGGILAKLSVTGFSTTGAEHVSNCHVNADIDGENIIGGVVAYAGRAPIYNNFVEGTLTASKNDQWGAGAQTAGVVGSLAEDWSGSTNKVVYGNIVAVSSITVPAADGEDEYINQSATSHRVVGYTSYNAEPEITGYDSSWNPIYSTEPNAADAGVQDNYVVGDLAVVDSSIEAGANTTEGATIKADDLTQAFAEGIGFVFGDNSSAPWMKKEAGLALYYEDALDGVSNTAVATQGLQRTANAFAADGCDLTVYNLQGVRIARAADRVSTATLAPGVYVVVADRQGRRVATAKFIVK